MLMTSVEHPFGRKSKLNLESSVLNSNHRACSSETNEGQTRPTCNLNRQAAYLKVAACVLFMAKRTVKPKATAKPKARAEAIDPFEEIAEDVVPVAKAVRKTRTAQPKTKDIPLAEAEAAAPKPRKRVATKAKTTTTPAKAADTSTTKRKRSKKAASEPTLDVTADLADQAPGVELSPVFKALAEPQLPDLQRENRARLMMQSPTELYFYWSVKENPYHVLRDVFGTDTGSYTLVLKLTELRTGAEEIHPAEAEGNWWFAVEPDGEYRAEIGFYAPNRPYFRILYSNTITTPRHAPSPHPAAEAQWRLPAHKFARVLDVAGFAQDAFDVAMAGDDPVTADETAHAAFKQFVGETNGRVRSVAAEDMRYTMVALAAGLKLDELRWRISPSLFAFLQSNADRLEAGNARTVLSQHFDIDETEFVEESVGPVVHGASLVNFPRTLKPRNVVKRFRSVSSHSVR